MIVPFLDLQAQYEALRVELDASVFGVLRSGRYVGGEQIDMFEREFAAYCNTQFAVGCGSGTAALHMALLALGIRQGDEVITVANTFAATVEAITHVGATPVFVDVQEDTGNLNPERIRGALSARSKAIVPVHLHGQCADMARILAIARSCDLRVIEDAAQAHGSESQGVIAGGIGDVGCFSFYPGKNLGACGEAGAVTTSDPNIAMQISLLVSHGERPKNHHSIVGFNHRLDSIQAAILRVKLRNLPAWNTRRREIAARYLQAFRERPDIGVPANVALDEHSFHHFVVRVRHRDAVMARLAADGVSTMVHYPVPLHRQPAYANIARVSGPLTVTDNLSSEILSLPIFPEMSDKQQDIVVKSLLKATE